MSGEGACEQTWESNRAVRMENVGDNRRVNPWLSNGRNNFRTLDEIVAAAITPGMTDKEKALALWFQEIRYRYHHDGNNAELGDPVKVFNVYGHNTCGNDSICLAGLWHKAGFKKVAPARAMGHCISQAFFDGRWNLLDGDQHVIYLLRDNETIANDQDIARDHDLVKRTHTARHPHARQTATKDEWQAADYVFDGEINGDRNCQGDTTMNMVLRPTRPSPGAGDIWTRSSTSARRTPSTRTRSATACGSIGPTSPRKPGARAPTRWRASSRAPTAWRPKRARPARSSGPSAAPTSSWAAGSRSRAAGPSSPSPWDGKKWEEAGQNLDKFFPADGTRPLPVPTPLPTRQRGTA